MKKMKPYTTPVVKVVAFQVEHGFAGSGELRLSLFNDELEEGYNAQSQENWVEEPSSSFGRWDN